MAFTLPTFNITCNIFTGPFPTRVLRLTSPCNLAVGRRMPQGGGFYIAAVGEGFGIMTLLVPALTDIRDYSIGAPYTLDIVECPAGTSRWYAVVGVDDYGKGFPNEHRFAYLTKIFDDGSPPFAGANWPTPIP